MFEDATDRERYYALLDEGVATYAVEVHQDVQMGNHVHLLVEAEMADVSKLMWFVNHRYALGYNKRHGRLNHLVGRRFHASAIPDRCAVRAVCVYIAMNPVRAGLCSHPGGWQYGSYQAHVTGDARPHLTTRLTSELFAGQGTTFEAAIERAIRLDRGGRPPLSAIMPSPSRLTPEHVRHARQVFGFTAPEIAQHYGTSARTVQRWLAA
jgi:REP element-mobilizing transposase RayT